MQGFGLVPTTGFEPARLLAPPPQDGMSTNFTTWAFRLQRYKKPINLSNKLFVVIQIFGKGFFQMIDSPKRTSDAQ